MEKGILAYMHNKNILTLTMMFKQVTPSSRNDKISTLNYSTNISQKLFAKYNKTTLKKFTQIQKRA
mgnify:CR=1 FL=1